MKTSTIIKLCLAAAWIDNTAAHPGMGRMLAELNAVILERQDPTSQAFNASNNNELIGDLTSLQPEQLSVVGKDIRDTISGDADGESLVTYPEDRKVPELGSSACKKETCCVWQYVVNDMVDAFTGPSGRCTTAARAAVRLGFHDASGWSKSTGPLGGADGSIILNADELESDPLNKGLEEIVATTKGWADKYAEYGAGVADMIQMGANVATVVCPLGPRVKTYVGRKDSSAKAPAPTPGDPNDSADHLLELFADKTISADGVVALIGAHSVAQQRFADPQRAGDPLDSTPGVWDTAYYTQVVSPMAPPRVFKLQSDINIATDPRTASLFKEFAAPDNGAQEPWNKAYAKAYVRLSLLGVDNINDLTDCTKVLPKPIKKFRASDSTQMREWTAMAPTMNIPAIAEAISDAKLITNVTDFENILNEQPGQTPQPNPTEPDDDESDSDSE